MVSRGFRSDDGREEDGLARRVTTDAQRPVARALPIRQSRRAARVEFLVVQNGSHGQVDSPLSRPPETAAPSVCSQWMESC